MKNIDLVALRKKNRPLYDNIVYSLFVCCPSLPVNDVALLYGVRSARAKEWILKTFRSCVRLYGVNAIELGYIQLTPDDLTVDFPYTFTAARSFLQQYPMFHGYCIFKMKREQNLRLVSPDTVLFIG